VTPLSDAEAPAVRLTGVHKRFGTAHVLRDVTFEVRPGEVHALAGANGSGKSTLMKVVYGAHRPTSGQVLVAGRPVALRSPADALRLGIAAVPQELPLVPSLSTAENIVFGDLPRRGGVVRWSAVTERAGAALRQVDGSGRIPLDQPVGTLDLAAQQLVAVARALARGAATVVFDEPTSALGPKDTDRLFEVIDRLRTEGRAVAFISQRLDDIFSVADRVSVLRDGQLVASEPTRMLDPTTVAELMVGGAVATVAAEVTPPTSDVVLQVEGLSAGRHLRDMTMSVHAGEVLGVAGLPGSGVDELLLALSGRTAVHAGKVSLDGTRLTHMTATRQARRGFAVVSGDRRREGLVAGQTVAFNLTLTLNRRAGLRPVAVHTQRRQVAELVGQLGIRPADPSAPVATLSGGNQQKVVVGRWLLATPRVWLLDDPTRGVDVHARRDIHRLVRDQVAATGAAAVMASSDVAELLEVCDRLLVVHRGRLAAELDPATATEHQVLAVAGGVAGSLARGGR
jgi:ABC-type sugar transport system ATPase subunit